MKLIFTLLTVFALYTNKAFSQETNNNSNDSLLKYIVNLRNELQDLKKK